MRITIFCSLLLLGCALSKTVTKALTESLGQEVIEIGAPLKELPPDLEEEPSLEKDDDDTTRASVAPATKRDVKKPAVPVAVDSRRKLKDIDRIDGVEQEDDEQRVEKEISEIYKDNDYKADSNEQRASGEKDNALRQRNQKTDFVFAPKNIKDAKEVEKFRTSPDYIDCKKKKLIGIVVPRYKFQPNLNNPKEVERFRTSPDDLACDRQYKLSICRCQTGPGLRPEPGERYGFDYDDGPWPRFNFFMFQPDLNNPAEVEFFKTSQDSISCDKQTKLNDQTKTTLQPDKAASTCVSMALLVSCAIGVYYG